MGLFCKYKIWRKLFAGRHCQGNIKELDRFIL